MQLYAGPSSAFIEEATLHLIAAKIGDAYYDYFRHRASASEFASWQNSLTALAQQFRYANLLDNGVVVELQLPSSSARLDCLIFGKSSTGGQSSAVLVELKQWSDVGSSDVDGCVEAFVGGAVRRLLHPSLQALQYAQYLEDTSEGFGAERGGALLFPCSWLHNMHPAAAGPLLTDAFRPLLERAPTFIQSDIDRFAGHLKEHVGGGKGEPIMDAAISARLAPSRKLLEYTARMVAGEPTYVLVDDQLVAYNAVLAAVRRGQRRKDAKSVVVVAGGPGTGKSLIALNLLGTLSRAGANVQHATGSKAFTTNLWRVLGSRSKAQIKYFNSYMAAEPGMIDVLLADEAHRIRTSSNQRFTPKAKRSERSQVDELVAVAKTSVFFLDDYQAIRPGEVGSTAMIRESAIHAGARYEQIDLRTQFRCAGSDEYIDWLDQLLEIRKTGTMTLTEAQFDFRVVEDPLALEKLIAGRLKEGASARLTAGFCWPWSKAENDGSLINDVVIGDFQRPWNAQHDARKLADGIPTASFWATDPAGFGQVGCVYTAQGFEFDYCGVIWGDDLVVRDGVWIGQPSASRDTMLRRGAGARFTDCVKNAYRVLMTRGMKGCYLYCTDAETADFVQARIAIGDS
jgi:hypothetical protein